MLVLSCCAQVGLSRPTSNVSPPQPENDEIPDALICPITQEIMTDPVIAADGHTYERRAILAWFIEHSTSPMTNKELSNLQVVPNQVVLDLISNLHSRRGVGEKD